MIGTKRVIDQLARTIVNHFLAVTISECLNHAAFNLPGRGERIDHDARVNRHDQLHDRHLPGLDINFHFGKLTGERRRRSRADVGGDGHKLALSMLVQRMQRDPFQTHRAPVGCNRMAVFQPDLAPVVQAKHHGRSFTNLVGHVLGRSFDRRPRDVGGGTGIGACVEWRHVRVTGVDNDIVHGHTEHFGRHLGQDRV